MLFLSNTFFSDISLIKIAIDIGLAYGFVE